MQQPNEQSIEQAGERDGEAGKQCVEGREIYTTQKLLEYVRMGREEGAEPPPKEFLSHIQSCTVCASNWWLVNEPVHPCERGNEVVSPRDMRAYLRSRERGIEMPVDVELHILGCDECRKNWEFIKYSDPILQQFRKKQVRRLITDVTEREAEDVYGTGAEGIAPEEMHGLTERFTAGLKGSRAEWFAILEDVYPLSRKIPSQAAEHRTEAVEKMFGILETVIKAGKMEIAISIEQAFLDVLGKLTENQVLQDPIFKLMGRLQTAGAGIIDLARIEDTPLELAVLVALAVGLPKTLEHPELLKRSEGAVFFNANLFQQTNAVTSIPGKSGVQ